MGGNGASDHYRNYSLDIYSGDRFITVGMIGNNKLYPLPLIVIQAFL